jgi:hypothetical protein
MASRDYTQVHDDIGPIQGQLDNPVAREFTTQAAENVRSIVASNGRITRIGDGAVVPKGTKRIIWSSEGYTYRGVTIPALTAAQKKATGSVATNISAASLPTGFTLPTTLDLSPARYLALVVSYTSLTGGSSPTIAFELDLLDDSAGPIKFPVWNPAAFSGATPILSYVNVGPGLTSPPASAPTGYANQTIATNWTVYMVPLVLLPNGNLTWTVTGSPTAASWIAELYGTF